MKLDKSFPLIVIHYSYLDSASRSQVKSSKNMFKNNKGEDVSENDYLIPEQEKISFTDVSYQVNFLQGRILTIIEAVITNEAQLKATKDLIKSSISDTHDWFAKLAYPELPMFTKNELTAQGVNVQEVYKQALEIK